MKRLIILLLLAAACLATGGRVLARDLIVATDTNFKPFSFKDDNGDYAGFDIDMWAAVAAKAGLKYRLQPMDFNGIIPGLRTGNVDVAVAAMSITAEREEIIDFSLPYYNSGLAILVLDGNERIRAIEDFKGKVVATKLGTSSVDYLKRNASDAEEIKRLPNVMDAIMELISGNCDAVFFDLPPLADYAAGAGKGKVKIVGRLYMRHWYGIGFPSGSELRDKVDVALLRLMESGEYDEIYRKWFDTVPR